MDFFQSQRRECQTFLYINKDIYKGPKKYFSNVGQLLFFVSDDPVDVPDVLHKRRPFFDQLVATAVFIGGKGDAANVSSMVQCIANRDQSATSFGCLPNHDAAR